MRALCRLLTLLQRQLQDCQPDVPNSNISQNQQILMSSYCLKKKKRNMQILFVFILSFCFIEGPIYVCISSSVTSESLPLQYRHIRQHETQTKDILHNLNIYFIASQLTNNQACHISQQIRRELAISVFNNQRKTYSMYTTNSRNEINFPLSIDSSILLVL